MTTTHKSFFIEPSSVSEYIRLLQRAESNGIPDSATKPHTPADGFKRNSAFGQRAAICW